MATHESQFLSCAATAIRLSSGTTALQADTVVINTDGRRVWLKESFTPRGKRVGVIDCCPESFLVRLFHPQLHSGLSRRTTHLFSFIWSGHNTPSPQHASNFLTLWGPALRLATASHCIARRTKARGSERDPEQAHGLFPNA